jgi:hypothetical protein
MDVKSESYEQIAGLSENKDYFYVVSMLDRPGANLFAVSLEYRYFQPGTVINNSFQMRLVKWPCMDSLLWYIITVPISYKEICFSVAQECKMRLADGVPFILASDREEWFPLRGDNVYTLENQSDSLIYQGPKGVARAKEEEEQACERIFEDFRQKN